jgi:hypothetical protein
MADDRIDVVFGAEFSDLLAAVQQIKTELDGLTAPVKALGDQFVLAGTRMTDGAQSGAAGWLDALHAIEGNALTIFNEVLSGTTTWQAAMEKLFADLAISFGEYVTEMILDWLAFEALGIGGGGGGSAGGLLGFAAGLLGGSGGGAGAAGAAGDLADFAMFQAGAWSIPRDMIALVQAGEMILPADVAATARAGGVVPGFPGGQAASSSSAGSNFALNVTVQAIDSAGVAQWANANAKTLAQTITRYMGTNPSVAG